MGTLQWPICFKASSQGLRRRSIGRVRATAQVTGVAGVLAALLFGAGNALWAFDQPPSTAPAARILDFYRADSHVIVIGATLSLASYVAFAVFVSGIRALLLASDGEIVATTALAGGLLLLAAGLGAETINMVGALRASGHQLTRSLGEAVFQISYVFGYNAAGIGVAILLLSGAASWFRRRTIAARAVALFLLGIGLVFLTPLSRYLLAPSVLLLLVVGIHLLRPRSLDTSRAPT